MKHSAQAFRTPHTLSEQSWKNLGNCSGHSKFASLSRQYLFQSGFFFPIHFLQPVLCPHTQQMHQFNFTWQRTRNTAYFLLWKEIPNIFKNSLAMWYCFDILITTYFFLILQLHLLQGFNPNSWHVSLRRHLCKRNQFTSLIKKHVGCKSEQRYSIINWLESHST